MLRYQGPWRITVVSKNASFDQRVVVRGPYGAKVLPGVDGASMDVDMDSWGLSLEHNFYGRNWQNNLRTIPGPFTEQDGVRSQVLTSNDCHWPGKAMNYPNFVVRLDQVVAGKVGRGEAPAPVSTATQSLRTAAEPGNEVVAQRVGRGEVSSAPLPAATQSVRTATEPEKEVEVKALRVGHQMPLGTLARPAGQLNGQPAPRPVERPAGSAGTEIIRGRGWSGRCVGSRWARRSLSSGPSSGLRRGL